MSGLVSVERCTSGRHRACTKPRDPDRRGGAHGPGPDADVRRRRRCPTTQLSALVAYVRYLDHPDNRGGQPLWYLGPVAEGGVAILIGLGVLLVACRWIGDRT